MEYTAFRRSRTRIKKIMSKYFEIDGYFKDDKAQFSRYLVKEFDDFDEEFDYVIFYYGLSESDLKNSSEDDDLDFVVTSFKEVNRADL